MISVVRQIKIILSLIFDRHEISHDMTLYQRAYLLNKENSESSAIPKTIEDSSELQTSINNRRDLLESQVPPGSTDFENHLLKKPLPSNKVTDQSTNTNVDSVLDVPSNVTYNLSAKSLHYQSALLFT